MGCACYPIAPATNKATTDHDVFSEKVQVLKCLAALSLSTGKQYSTTVLYSVIAVEASHQQEASGRVSRQRASPTACQDSLIVPLKAFTQL